MTETLSFDRSFEFAYGEPAGVGRAVLRVVAENPGPFTFKGTNTYLVGDRKLAVIDPGPDHAPHIDAIVKAAAGRPITHILITHTHRDHVAGLARLVAATGATTCGYGSVPLRHASADEAHGRDEHSDRSFVPGVALRDGDEIEAGDQRLTALHTPGHAPDHLCFALAGDERILFSGDHVMGWNTSVVAPPDGRMGDYIAALERLTARDDARYLPGHGGHVSEPQRWVRGFIVHRRMREQAIVEAIRAGNDTIRRIVPAVYPGLDPRLSGAAALSVEAHVIHLLEQGRLRSSGPSTLDRPLSLA